MALAISTAPARPLVLIVDSNDDLVSTLSAVLQLSGFAAASAATAAKAETLFEELHPEAVVMELRLPGGVDALQLCKRMRELGGPSPLIVAQTSWLTKEIRHQADTAGFDQCLMKPGEPCALIRLLATTQTRQSAQ